jgi:hypothetical protein
VSSDEPVLVDPWKDLRGGLPEDADELAAIESALATEIQTGHLLSGRDYEVVGRCYARDDVLLRLSDGPYALVHLTYGGPQRPPWPSTKVLADAAAVEEEVRFRDGA